MTDKTTSEGGNFEGAALPKDPEDKGSEGKLLGSAHKENNLDFSVLKGAQ